MDSNRLSEAKRVRYSVVNMAATGTENVCLRKRNTHATCTSGSAKCATVGLSRQSTKVRHKQEEAQQLQGQSGASRSSHHLVRTVLQDGNKTG